MEISTVTIIFQSSKTKSELDSRGPWSDTFFFKCSSIIMMVHHHISWAYGEKMKRYEIINFEKGEFWHHITPKEFRAPGENRTHDPLSSSLDALTLSYWRLYGKQSRNLILTKPVIEDKVHSRNYFYHETFVMLIIISIVLTQTLIQIYSWLPITRTLTNSNQNRFPLDFRHTFTVILPSVTWTLDNSKLLLTRRNFCFPSDHFYIILPSITRTMFWALKKSGKKSVLPPKHWILNFPLTCCRHIVY